jgi:hypothetical protein
LSQPVDTNVQSPRVATSTKRERGVRDWAD